MNLLDPLGRKNIISTYAHIRRFNGDFIMKSGIEKQSTAEVVVLDLMADQQEIGWLKREAEESEKVYVQLRQLLGMEEKPSTDRICARQAPVQVSNR